MNKNQTGAPSCLRTSEERDMFNEKWGVKEDPKERAAVSISMEGVWGGVIEGELRIEGRSLEMCCV